MAEGDAAKVQAEMEASKEGSSNNGAAAGDAKKPAGTPAAIARQVEHYFGDFNLPRDNFLLEQTKADEGWVSMETMLKFKRLAALSASDPDAIVSALKEAGSGLMEVDADGKRVRRDPSKPVPEHNDERKAELARCTVYAKGFDKKETTLDELLDHFAAEAINVINVQLRNYVNKKDNSKGFKGSVFLTFGDRASAEAFLARDKYEYKGVELVRKWQADYVEEKKKEFEEKKNKQSQAKKAVKEAREAKKEKEEDEDDGEENGEEEEGLPKGAVLYVKGLNEETFREDIKKALKELYEVDPDDVAFVYYQKGEEEAKLRFKKEGAAKALVEGKIPAEGFEVKGAKVTASVMEGEEETAFLKKCLSEIKEWRSKNKKGFGHKRRHGGGGGGRGGGRGGKRQKTS